VLSSSTLLILDQTICAALGTVLDGLLTNNFWADDSHGCPAAVGRYQADYKRWLQAGQVPQEEQLLLQAVLAVQLKQWKQAVSAAAAALRLLRTQVRQVAGIPLLGRLHTASCAAWVTTFDLS
jgi:hypothetical protein